MFKKVPYGVKVRVRGSDETGYSAEYAINCNRFLPFFDMWSSISYYDRDMGFSSKEFPTLEAAKTGAMKEYDTWIDYFHCKEAEMKLKRRISKKIVWEHP